MNLVLVGHRGSGKTTTLHWLKSQFEGVFFDLDEEIERRNGSIKDFFLKKGEIEFRNLERQVFEELTRREDGATQVIALGAGFEGALPKNCIKIWIRRESDLNGRIFLDRPTLELGKSPLEEWKIRFSKRQKNYEEIHDDVLTLPEGKWLLNLVFSHFFKRWFRKENSTLTMEFHDFFSTLLPKDLHRLRTKILYQESSHIELREDLFTTDALKKLADEVPSKKIYFSYRIDSPKRESVGELRDWDLCLGEPPKTTWSVSCHEQQTHLFKDHLKSDKILKWSPEVKTFKELLDGHLWQQEDPLRRAFLPRSFDGRWRWYRRLFGTKMPIHFVKDECGSAPDQPFWYETLLPDLSDRGFAAVLGSSVDLSWTPSFHHDFFKQRKMPVVSVQVGLQEWSEALLVLKSLGLRAAAITSPLKLVAFSGVSQFLNESSRNLGSVNTLLFDQSQTYGVSTDLDALLSLAQEVQGPFCLWGGGGLLPILNKAFPNAESFEARKGGRLSCPSTLIWASRRSTEVVFPENPEMVRSIIDMNYFEDSMGKELAKELGCDYLSGESFFIDQAKAQQMHWGKWI